MILFRDAILKKNSAYNPTILNETSYSVDNSINDNKLEFLQNVNDAEELGNLDYLTDDINSYSTKFKDNLDKLLTVANDEISKMSDELSNGTLWNTLKRIDDIRDKTNVDFSDIKFNMYDYDVKRNDITYIDLEGLLGEFDELMRKGVTDSDLIDLNSNNSDFLQYVCVTASGSDDIDSKNYRQSLRSLYRSDLVLVDKSLYQDTITDMIGEVTDSDDWITYIDAERKRLTEFGNTIKYFLNTLSSNSIVNDILNPNVSVNENNKNMARYSNRAESVSATRRYLMSFMDLLYSILQVYISTVVEKTLAIKNQLDDITDILNSLVNANTESVTLSGTSNSTDYHSEFMDVSNYTTNTINESYTRLSTIKPREIILESTSTLLEATELNTKISDSLKLMSSKIAELTNKFKTLITTVHSNNSDWLTRIKQFNVRSIKNSDKTVVEIYPYWINYNLMGQFKIPAFNDKDIQILISDENQYNKQYFGKFVTAEGKLDIATVLRGGKPGTTDFQKVQYSGLKLAGIYTNLWVVIDKSDSTTQSLVTQNKMIKQYLDSTNESNSKQKPLTESALLESSLFAEDLLMVLNEANGPMTTDEYEKTSTNTKTTASDNKQRILAIQKYARICYGVNAIRMQISEEAYNSAVTGLAGITKNTKMRKEADSKVKRPDDATTTKPTDSTKNKIK